MSWISKNYEKALLAGAVVSVLGLAYLGISGLSTAEEELAVKPRGPASDDTSVKDADKVATAISSLKRSRLWSSAEVEGRPVDLLTGVALFVNKNDPDNPVDLEKSKEVHEGIPNRWWLENRVDPGFSDSPSRDHDDDGFTNREEFDGQTNPSDPRSYPNLIAKLRFVRDESIQWFIRPGLDVDGGAFTFEYKGDNGNERVNAANPIPKGEAFFKEPKNGVLKNRFKYIDFEVKRVMDPRIQEEVEVTMVKVEDLKPNKAGTIYEIPAMFRQNEWRNHSKFDRTAVFSLEALGQEGQEIKLEEYTQFTLPIGGKGKKFELTQVTPEQVTIVEDLGDGKTKEYVISKGALGTP